MSEIVKVKFGIMPIAHDSFETATQASKRPELAFINGKILVAYEFNGHDLVLRLDNAECYISIGANCITWLVGDNFLLSDKSNPPLDIIFEYPTGEIQVWDWKSKFESLIGKKLHFLQVISSCFYIQKTRKSTFSIV